MSVSKADQPPQNLLRKGLSWLRDSFMFKPKPLLVISVTLIMLQAVCGAVMGLFKGEW